MQNREFEKNMQQKMGELKFVPSDAVWDKVEAGLPKKEKNRRRVFFILFFAALLFSSIVWVNKTGKAGKEAKDNIEVAKVNIEPNTITKNEAENKKTVNDTASLIINQPAKVLTGNNTNRKKSTSASLKIKIKNGVTGIADSTANDNLTSNNQKKMRTSDIVKTRIKTPVQYVIDNERNEEGQIGNEDNGKLKVTNSIDTAVAIVENKTEEKEIINADSLTINKKDTTEVIVANIDEKKKTGKISKWQYGIYAASGSSNVTNKLFNNTPVFGGSISAYTSGAPATPPNSVVNTPSNPSGSLAFSTGFFTSKSINSNWRFSTGLNYMYQSNAIKTGNKVDTAVTVNYGLNKSISASNYYRAGNTVSYKNKFHLVEIPLLFQFNLFAKPTIYLEAGTTISYLVKSNALVYDLNSSSYITDAAIFNRVLFTANAGIGINVLQKSKLPFSIGYQFKYGAVSVVKNSFGKQHFVNSLLFLKVPFKK